MWNSVQAIIAAGLWGGYVVYIVWAMATDPGDEWSSHDQVKADFVRLYLAWLIGEQQEEPTGLDFPDLTDGELEDGRQEARWRAGERL